MLTDLQVADILDSCILQMDTHLYLEPCKVTTFCNVQSKEPSASLLHHNDSKRPLKHEIQALKFEQLEALQYTRSSPRAN